MDSLELVRTFRAVALHGSFSKAADELGLSKANVSKYISALEAQFNVRLLNRTTRSVSLTDAGIVLLERSEPLIEMIDSARSELQTRALQPSGRVRVSAVYFVDTELARVIAEFCRNHPKVHVSLELSNRPVDLVEEAVDIALRVGPVRSSDLIVRKLRPVSMALVASPEYLRQHGRPRHPDDLASHRGLIFNTDNTPRSGQRAWSFRDGKGGTLQVPMRGSLDSNDGRPLREFAASGLGIAYMPREMVQHMIDDGQVETVLDEYVIDDYWLMLAYAQRRHNSAALRALAQFLEQRLA